MQYEELGLEQSENTVESSRIQKRKDPLVCFVTVQMVICGIVLLAVILLRLLGGELYYTVRREYDKRFSDVTKSSEISDATNTPIPTQTDIVVHTIAPVSSTSSDLPQGGGDSLDDSMALQSEEALLIGTSYQTMTSENAMQAPLKGRITSPFGYRIHPIYGTRLFHNGIDIGAETGTPVHSALSGKVVVAEYDNSYGNYVVIDHGNDFCTVYAHCSRLLVSAGDRINKGEAIAQVGSTGVSTGPHLHFEVRRGEYHIDPLWLVKIP